MLGLAALGCDENTLALHAFERVTLQNPNHAGAWIDLAVANVRLGDGQSAEGLLAFVENSFEPPPALRAQIQQVRQQLQAQQLAERRAEQLAKAQTKDREQSKTWRGEWWFQAGHTNNANAGVATSGITLTPTGADPVYLALDPSRKPRSDAIYQWRGLLQHVQPLNSDDETKGFSEWVIQARHKELPNTTGYNAQDIGLAYSQDRPIQLPWAQMARLIAGVGVQTYQMGGVHLLDSTLLHAGIKQPISATCSTLARVEIEHRDYQPAGYTDATLQWLTGRIYCTYDKTGVALGARVGQDRPDALRAGGIAYRKELTLDVLHAISPVLVLEGSLVVGVAEDQQGYSPLMANNRSRSSAKTNWRVALNWAVEKHWSVVGSIEEYKEEANMPLFNFVERQLLLGLRYGF
ncbi:MAG: hypothetical protein RIR18_578, partial [Pseudomonadota bacterium]|jgi:hypothetical protein